MATVVDDIIVRFIGRTGNLDAAVQKVSRGLNGLGRIGAVAGGAVTGLFGGIAGAATLAAAELEQTAVAFRVLTGDMRIATSLMHDMEQFSARTPFELSGVEAAGKKLLAMGFTAEQIIPTLHDVGNVTAGIGIEGGRFDRIIHNLAQVGTQGHLTSREFRDFAVNGVPLMEALRATMSGLPSDAGAATAAIDEMIQRGEVSFADVRRAFRFMATQGRFKDLMFEQSNTLLGMLSNIRDKATIILRDIGQTFVEPIKSILRPILLAMDAFSQLGAQVKKTIGIILIVGTAGGALLTTLGIGLMMLGGAIILIGPAITALTALGAVLAPLLAPAAALTAVMIGLGMAGLAAQGYEASFAGLKEFIVDMIPTFKQWASNIVGFFYNIGHNWKVVVEFIKQNWLNFITFAPKLLIDAILMAFEMVVINTKNLVNTMFRIFGVFWKSLSSFVTPILNFIFSGEMIRVIWEGLKKAWKLFSNFFTRLWEGAKTGNFDLGESFAEGMDLQDKKGLLGALNEVRKQFFEDLQFASSNFDYFDMSALDDLILIWDELEGEQDDWKIDFDDIMDDSISNIQELRNELWELQQMFANRDDFDITQEGLVFGWATVKDAIEEATEAEKAYAKSKEEAEGKSEGFSKAFTKEHMQTKAEAEGTSQSFVDTNNLLGYARGPAVGPDRTLNAALAPSITPVESPTPQPVKLDSQGPVQVVDPVVDAKLDQLLQEMTSQNHTTQLRTVGEGGEDFPL